jgi:hypothetical protein
VGSEQRITEGETPRELGLIIWAGVTLPTWEGQGMNDEFERRNGSNHGYIEETYGRTGYRSVESRFAGRCRFGRGYRVDRGDRANRGKGRRASKDLKMQSKKSVKDRSKREEESSTYEDRLSLPFCFLYVVTFSVDEIGGRSDLELQTWSRSGQSQTWKLKWCRNNRRDAHLLADGRLRCSLDETVGGGGGRGESGKGGLEVVGRESLKPANDVHQRRFQTGREEDREGGREVASRWEGKRREEGKWPAGGRRLTRSGDASFSGSSLSPTGRTLGAAKWDRM